MKFINPRYTTSTIMLCSMDIFRYSFIEGNHTAVFAYTLCVRAARHLIIFLYWRMARNYFEFVFLLVGSLFFFSLVHLIEKTSNEQLR